MELRIDKMKAGKKGMSAGRVIQKRPRLRADDKVKRAAYKARLDLHSKPFLGIPSDNSDNNPPI